MSKLNQQYHESFSYYIYLETEISRFFNWLEVVTKTGNTYKGPSRFDRNSGAKIIGALQPLADMYKDFTDTFKAYKAPYQKRNDLMQPLRGLGNIVKAIGIFIGVPLFFLINSLRYIALTVTGFKPETTVRQNFYQTTAWLIEGVATLLRGVTQVIATPLVYIFETPLRMYLTKKNGERKIEDNNGVHRLINEGMAVILNGNGRFWYSDDNELGKIILDLHVTKYYEYKNKRGQKTDIDNGLEKDFHNKAYYAGDTQVGYKEKIVQSLNYFSLFKKVELSDAQLNQIRKRVSDPAFTYTAPQMTKR